MRKRGFCREEGEKDEIFEKGFWRRESGGERKGGDIREDLRWGGGERENSDRGGRAGGWKWGREGEGMGYYGVGRKREIKL